MKRSGAAVSAGRMARPARASNRRRPGSRRHRERRRGSGVYAPIGSVRRCTAMKLLHVLSAAAIAAPMLGMPAVELAQQSTTPADAPQAGTAISYRSLADLKVVGAGGERVGEVEEALVDAARRESG